MAKRVMGPFMDGKSWENGGKMEGRSGIRWFFPGGWWILALCDRKRMVNDGDVQASDA